MAKYKMTIRCTGVDFEEKISFLGLYVTRKGQMMEMEVEAPDEESAKNIILSAIGSGNKLLLEAKKI